MVFSFNKFFQELAVEAEGRPDREEETVVAVHMKNGTTVLGVL